MKLLEKWVQIMIIYCPNTFSSRLNEEAKYTHIHTHAHTQDGTCEVAFNNKT